MVSANWKIVRLHDVAQIQTGLALGKKNMKDPVSVPYLRVANVQDGHLDLSVIKEVQIERREVHKYLLRKGDVLLTEGGDFDKLGRGAVWQGAVDPCIHQNHIFAVRPKKNVLIPQFLSLLTASSHGKTYFLKCSKQSTNLASMNSSQLRMFPVLLPPVQDQENIVNIVCIWDHAIEKTECLIASKEERKKILMQLFLTGKRRLRGFQKPWSKYCLGELFKERVERANDHLPLLSITREDGVLPRVENRKDTSSEDKSNYLRICPGDIGYNTMRMWQGVSAISFYEGIVSPAYTICIPNKGVDGKYMAHLFKLPHTINLFYRFSQGLTSDTWNLKYHHFEKIKVTIPEIEEQKAIANVLDACTKEINLLRNNVSSLQRQRRGLMQKLLTGQWRVKAQGETM